MKQRSKCPGTGQLAKRITKSGSLWHHGPHLGTVFQHHQGVCPVCDREFSVFYRTETMFFHSVPKELKILPNIILGEE